MRLIQTRAAAGGSSRRRQLYSGRLRPETPSPGPRRFGLDLEAVVQTRATRFK